MATTAVAENQRAAASVGLSPDRIAALNWALGSALAAVAGILIAPIVSLQVAVMTNIVLAALAAALVAGFRSFPLALVGGLILGILQTEADRYMHTPGAAQSLPAIAIVVWMIIRGQALPLRDYFLQRLPSVGSGRIRPGLLAITVVAVAILINAVPAQWQDAFVTTFAIGIILLSVVVITGYAGQLSLAQFALAGFGALVAGRLADVRGWPFPLALLAGVVATVPLGALFALPAVRSRGINLAIATLALGTAVELMIFNNFRFVGGFAGTEVGRPTLFGLKIDAIKTPGRYAIVCMVFFVARRLGRRQHPARAIRAASRWRCAPTSGPRPRWASASPAPRCTPSRCRPASPRWAARCSRSGPTSSSTATSSRTSTRSSSVAYAFIGGIGYLFGPMNGSTLAPGSLGANISELDLRGHRQVGAAHRRRDPDPAGAAEPERHRRRADQAAAHDPQAGQDDAAVAHRRFRRVLRPEGRARRHHRPRLAAVARVRARLRRLGDEVPDQAGRAGARSRDHQAQAAEPARRGPRLVLPTLPAATDVRDRVPPRTLEIDNVTVRYGGVVPSTTSASR